MATHVISVGPLYPLMLFTGHKQHLTSINAAVFYTGLLNVVATVVIPAFCNKNFNQAYRDLFGFKKAVVIGVLKAGKPRGYNSPLVQDWLEDMTSTSHFNLEVLKENLKADKSKKSINSRSISISSKSRSKLLNLDL